MKSSRVLCGTLVGLLLLGVAGCGSNNNDSAAAGPTPDAFVGAAVQIAATSPEDTEPVSIDALVATAPEDTEPVNL
jgi:hypothetical protein